MLLIFDNYNTNNTNTNAAQHDNNGIQYGKYTANNIKLEIQQTGTVAEFKYIGVHSDGCGDWRSVLESRNWTALRTLDLCNTAINNSD